MTSAGEAPAVRNFGFGAAGAVVVGAVVEAAAAVDPSDPASVQKIADMARSSQHAASAISDYLRRVLNDLPDPTEKPMVTAWSVPGIFTSAPEASSSFT